MVAIMGFKLFISMVSSTFKKTVLHLEYSNNILFLLDLILSMYIFSLTQKNSDVHDLSHAYGARLAHIFHLIISRNTSVLMENIDMLETVFWNQTVKWKKSFKMLFIFNTSSEITIVISDIYSITALMNYLLCRKHHFVGKSILLSKLILKRRK